MSSDPVTDPTVLWLIIIFLAAAMYMMVLPKIMYVKELPGVPPEHRGSPLHHLYRHYKGGVYLLLTIAVHEATKERYAVYQSTETGVVYARPLQMFQEKFEPYQSSNI